MPRAKYVLASDKLKKQLGPAFFRLQEMLLEADFSHGRNLEKLGVSKKQKNVPRSIRYDLKARVIFTPVLMDKTLCYVLLEFLTDHNHDGCQFLEVGGIRRYFANPRIEAELTQDFLRQNAAGTTLVTASDSKEEAASAPLSIEFDDDEEDDSPVIPQEVYIHDGKLFMLSPEQEIALQGAEYSVVAAFAGAGKTHMAVARLTNFYNPRDEKAETKPLFESSLYTTESETLLRVIQHQYRANLQGEGSPIEFLTFSEVVKRACPETRNFKEVSASFAAKWMQGLRNLPVWFSKLLENPKSFAVVYEEWRMLSGMTLDAYLGVSEDDSPIFYIEPVQEAKSAAKKSTSRVAAVETRVEKKTYVFGLFQRYIKELAASRLIDMRFPPAPNVAEADKPQHVGADEAANLSTRAAWFLTQLVAKNHLHQPAITFYLDSNQSPDSYPKLNYFTRDLGIKHVVHLASTFRCSRSVIGVLNLLFKINNYLGQGTLEHNMQTAIQHSHNENEGRVSLIDENPEHQTDAMRNQLRTLTDNTSCLVIIPHAELKAQAMRDFPRTPILTTAQAQGLQFKNIILYKFLERPEHREISASLADFDPASSKDYVHRAKEGKANHRYRGILHELIVGSSRAIEQLVFFGNMDIAKKENRPFVNLTKHFHNYVAHNAAVDAKDEAKLETPASEHDWTLLIKKILVNYNPHDQETYPVLDEAARMAKVHLGLSLDAFKKSFELIPSEDKEHTTQNVLSRQSQAFLGAKKDIPKKIIAAFLKQEDFSSQLFQTKVGTTGKTVFEKLIDEFKLHKNVKIRTLFEILISPDHLSKIRPQDLLDNPQFKAFDSETPLTILLNNKFFNIIIGYLQVSVSALIKQREFGPVDVKELDRLVSTLTHFFSKPLNDADAQMNFELLKCLLVECSHIKPLPTSSSYPLAKTLLILFYKIPTPVQGRYIRDLSQIAIICPAFFILAHALINNNTLALMIAHELNNPHQVRHLANEDFMKALCRPVIIDREETPTEPMSYPSSLFMLAQVKHNNGDSETTVLNRLITIKPELFHTDYFASALFTKISSTYDELHQSTAWFWLTANLAFRSFCFKLITINSPLFCTPEFNEAFLNERDIFKEGQVKTYVSCAYIMSKESTGIQFYHQLIHINPDLFRQPEFMKQFCALNTLGKYDGMLFQLSQSELGLAFIKKLFVVNPKLFSTDAFRSALLREFSPEEIKHMAAKNCLEKWHKTDLGKELIGLLKLEETFKSTTHLTASQSEAPTVLEILTMPEKGCLPKLKAFLDRDDFSHQLFQKELPCSQNTLFNMLYLSNHSKICTKILLLLDLLKSPNYIHRLDLEELYKTPKNLLLSPLASLASFDKGRVFIDAIVKRLEIDSDEKKADSPSIKTLFTPKVVEFYEHLIDLIPSITLPAETFIVCRDILLKYINTSLLSNVQKNNLQHTLTYAARNLGHRPTDIHLSGLAKVLLLDPNFIDYLCVLEGDQALLLSVIHYHLSHSGALEDLETLEILRGLCNPLGLVDDQRFSTRAIRNNLVDVALHLTSQTTFLPFLMHFMSQKPELFKSLEFARAMFSPVISSDNRINGTNALYWFFKDADGAMFVENWFKQYLSIFHYGEFITAFIAPLKIIHEGTALEKSNLAFMADTAHGLKIIALILKNNPRLFKHPEFNRILCENIKGKHSLLFKLSMDSKGITLLQSLMNANPDFFKTHEFYEGLCTSFDFSINEKTSFTPLEMLQRNPDGVALYQLWKSEIIASAQPLPEIPVRIQAVAYPLSASSVFFSTHKPAAEIKEEAVDLRLYLDEEPVANKP